MATPIVVGGSVYIQDALSNVYAFDRANGRLRWVHHFDATNLGRNGLAYSSGSLYGATDTTAFALSAASGRLRWQQFLITPEAPFVDIAPLVANNLVYLSTVGYPPDGRGAIYALDAHTGAVRWSFTTVKGAWRHPNQAGGGGAWYTPSLGAGNVLYVGVANPYPLGGSPTLRNGAAYAGSALYTDSLLALDARTGKLLWYDQVTPHDLRDYDFQLPPLLVTEASGRHGERLVISSGKAGEVIAWNALTHQRVWQARVGVHRNDRGPLPARPVLVCPGFYGGVETPMAFEGGRVFVPVVDLCALGSSRGYEPIQALDPVRGSGELVALDVRDGAVLWRRKLPQPDFGCATAADGVVFTSSFDGELYAFSADDGATLWRARAPTGINACPALSGNMLIVAAGSDTSRHPNAPFELVAYAT